MVKIILNAVFIFLLFIRIPMAQVDETPWEVLPGSALKGSKLNSPEFTLLDEILCTQDSLENKFCIEFVWKNGCFQGFGFFSLSDKFPYILTEKKVPVLQVDQFNTISSNGALNIVLEKGLNFPWDYEDDNVLWPVQLGEITESVLSETSFVNHLLRGKELAIYFGTQDGPVMRTTVPLENLVPLLEAYLYKAEAAKPSEQQCSG